MTKEYSKKLKDPRWKEFAKKVYAKDGHSCGNNCGWTSSIGVPLQAHHKVYYIDGGKKVEPWDYPLGDMETLCESCHKAYHNTLTPPIIDKKTNKIINEDEPTRKTRLAIEKMKKKELEEIKKGANNEKR